MNQFIPLKERLEKLPIVKSVLAANRGWNSYYGMNVGTDPRMEPLDQLDGFLVAKFIQNQEGSLFYPFIAGAYDCLNAQTPKEAKTVARRKYLADERKREFLSRIMKNLGLNGKVYTTYDLWEREDYWEIFGDIVPGIDLDEIRKRSPRKGMRMAEFPKVALGKMKDIIGDKIDDWYSAWAYIPAEVAEAVWFKENCSVSFKIGPAESEAIYDDIIFSMGIGIIGLTQPQYATGWGLQFERMVYPGAKSCVPYVAKAGQNRVLFSDTMVDLAFLRNTGYNPSFERAKELVCVFEQVKGEGSPSVVERVWVLIKLGGQV